VADLLALGKEVLASQPFSVLLGAELAEFREGYVELRLTITDRLEQQHGFVDGGVISYAVDNTLTSAGGSVLGAVVVTSEFKANYLRPARGEVLIARPTVFHASKSRAVGWCDVFISTPEDERLGATEQGTISRLGQAQGA
jgi:uncharacterized protein (TIGR00369 family)